MIWKITVHDYGTSAEYRDVLNLLGLTQAEMAELLGVSVRTAHGYAISGLCAAFGLRFWGLQAADVPVARGDLENLNS